MFNKSFRTVRPFPQNNELIKCLTNHLEQLDLSLKPSTSNTKIVNVIIETQTSNIDRIRSTFDIFFNILFLNRVIKLLARWRIQTLWYAYGSNQPRWASFIIVIMLKCRSDITQSPLLWVTPILIHAKNHLQLSIFSPFIKAKATGNN